MPWRQWIIMDLLPHGENSHSFTFISINKLFHGDELLLDVYHT